MIVIPTRRRLERRRNALYQHLQSVLHHASTQQVEDIMRQIHTINLRLLNYFIHANEPKEIFPEEPF